MDAHDASEEARSPPGELGLPGPPCGRQGSPMGAALWEPSDAGMTLKLLGETTSSEGHGTGSEREHKGTDRKGASYEVRSQVGRRHIQQHPAQAGI